MVYSLRPLLFFAFIFGFLTGCSVVKEVTVNSEPPEATVKVDGTTVGKTPMKVSLKALRAMRLKYIISVEKEGYKTGFADVFTYDEEFTEGLECVLYCFPCGLLLYPCVLIQNDDTHFHVYPEELNFMLKKIQEPENKK